MSTPEKGTTMTPNADFDDTCTCGHFWARHDDNGCSSGDGCLRVPPSYAAKAPNVSASEPAHVLSVELVAFVSSGEVDPRHKVCGPIDYSTTGLQVCTAGGHGQWTEGGCAWAVRVAGAIEALFERRQVGVREDPDFVMPHDDDDDFDVVLPRMPKSVERFTLTPTLSASPPVGMTTEVFTNGDEPDAEDHPAGGRVAALEAEVERLRDALKWTQEAYVTGNANRVHLRDRAEAAEAERDALRAQVKRLTITPDHLDTMLGIDPNDPLSKFAAEIIRLRRRLARMTLIARERGEDLAFADAHLPQWEAIRAERDLLGRQVEDVLALADEWAADSEDPLPWAAERLRAALSSSEPVTAGEDDAACTCCDEAKKHSFLAHPDCPVHNPPAGEVTPPAEQRAEDGA